MGKIPKKELKKNFEVFKKGVERLGELEEELNALDTSGFKHEEHQIRRKLKNVSLIPEIEEEIRVLRLKVAGINTDLLKSRIDKNQEIEIRRISKGEKELEHQQKDTQFRVGRQMPELRAKIFSLENEIVKTEKLARRKELSKEEKEKIRDIPTIRNKLNYLKSLFKTEEEKVEKLARRKELSDKERAEISTIPDVKIRISSLRDLITKEKKQLESKISAKKFYGKKRILDEIKEIESLDETQSNRLNFLRRELQELEKLLPSFAERIQSSEEEISRVRELASIKPLSKYEINSINQIPSLKRKISYLQNEEGFVESELGRELEILPKLQKKTSFLGRLFRKEEEELKELETKVDKNKVDFYRKLSEDLAESRRAIEEEKYAMRSQIIALTSEVVKRLKKEKEVSDIKILNEIEELKNKIEESKKDMSQNVISKVVQLKGKIDESKRELHLDTERQLESLKREINKSKVEVEPALEYKLEPQVKEPELEEVSEQPRSEFLGEKVKFVSAKKIKISGPSKMLLVDSNLADTYSDLPEFPPLRLSNSKKGKNLMFVSKKLEIKPLDISLLKKIKIQMPKNEKVIEKTSEKIEKKRKIPKSIFLEQIEFINLSNDVYNLKDKVEINLGKVSENLTAKKEFHSGEMLKFDSELKSLKINLKKFALSFPVK